MLAMHCHPQGRARKQLWPSSSGSNLAAPGQGWKLWANREIINGGLTGMGRNKPLQTQGIDVVPLSMWTGETEREGICHKCGHDLIATSGYFWAKPRLGRLIGHHPKNRSYRVWEKSLQPFPVPASHLFFLRHCCSPFPGNSGQNLGCLPLSSSQNSKNAWEKVTPLHVSEGWFRVRCW